MLLAVLCLPTAQALTLNVAWAQTIPWFGKTTVKSSGADVAAGDNQVGLCLPLSKQQVFTTRSSVSSDTIDPDANNNVALQCQELTGATLGGFVWEDLNGDGVQQGDEASLANVSVQLLNNSGTVLRTTTIDATGNFEFGVLPASTYTLKVSAASGYRFTLANMGGNDTLDSDVNPSSGQTESISLVANETKLQWAAGLYRPITISDVIWTDTNNNRKQDGGEVGIANAKVYLYRRDNTLVAQTVTDLLGRYTFANMPPGDYSLQVVPPSLN